MTVFRVLSYNIHKGFSSGNRRFVLVAIRQALRSLAPDLVFLQEVVGAHERHAQRHTDWPSASQFEFLADSVWPHHAYGRNAVYPAGHHGNAILSRGRVASWENCDISTNPLERRGMLHAVLHGEGKAPSLHAICTHLDLHGFGRAMQVGRLCARVAAAVPPDAPLIIAGDFNDWRSRSARRLELDLGLVEVHRAVHGRHARTFPAMRPLLALDRIYVRGWVPVRAEVLRGEPWRALSDHAPLLAELRPE